MRYRELSPSLKLGHSHLPHAHRRAIADVITARERLQRRVRKYEAALSLSKHSLELIGVFRIAHTARRVNRDAGGPASVAADRKFALDVTVQLHWREAASRMASVAVQEFSSSVTDLRIAVERTNELTVIADAGPFQELERVVHCEYFPQSSQENERRHAFVGEGGASPGPCEAIGWGDPTEGTLQTLVEIDRDIYELLHPAEALRSMQARWL